MNNLFNQILIYTGAVFILFGIYKSFRILPRLKKRENKVSWFILIGLMLTFIFAYIYAIYMVNLNRFDELTNLTSAIFGAGGVFVFIAISIATKTITTLSKLTSGLELKVEERSKELLDHKAKAMMNSKLSTLGEMAAGIAHEINNPLMIIYSASSQVRRLLEADKINATQIQDHAIKIESTVERISKIIKGLRHFAQDSEKEANEAITLEELITSTSGLCHERFMGKNIDFQIMPIPEVSFQCRSIQLSQVLLNLLNNSYDAIANQIVKKIIISFHQLPGFIEVIVSDNGPGIPNEVQDKMMQPFYSTKPVGKGMGLGLSISKGIMEEHQGVLYYDPTPSLTRFVMRIPV